MKNYLKTNSFIVCMIVVFLLSACAHNEVEDKKINETEVQKKNTSQEASNTSLDKKITQETMDKLYANMPYDEMVKIVGFEPTTSETGYKYNISGTEFEENNCTLDLVFGDNGLDDANTGYMDFKYPQDTKIIETDDYCNLKIGDSLISVRKKMGNAMRFNKIWWDELQINPKEYQAIVEGGINVILHFSNDILDKKYIADEMNTNTLSFFKTNSDVTDFGKIHSGMKVEDIKNILGSEGYIIGSSAYTDYDHNVYLWKISDEVGLEVSIDGLYIRIVGEEIKVLE